MDNESYYKWQISLEISISNATDSWHFAIPNFTAAAQSSATHAIIVSTYYTVSLLILIVIAMLVPLLVETVLLSRKGQM